MNECLLYDGLSLRCSTCCVCCLYYMKIKEAVVGSVGRFCFAHIVQSDHSMTKVTQLFSVRMWTSFLDMKRADVIDSHPSRVRQRRLEGGSRMPFSLLCDPPLLRATPG